MLLGLYDEFKFGKHEGEIVEEVLQDDPEYVRWCIENLEGVTFTEEVEAATP